MQSLVDAPTTKLQGQKFISSVARKKLDLDGNSFTAATCIELPWVLQVPITKELHRDSSHGSVLMSRTPPRRKAAAV